MTRSPSPRPRRRRPGPPLVAAAARTLLVGLAWALCLGSPAEAELVVLDDGSHFKVVDFQLVEEKRMRLSLPSGGRIALPLERIVRIVDDEVPLPPPPAPPGLEAAAEPAPPPPRSWRFDEEEPIPDTPYGEMIYAVAKRHEVSPELVAAVVRAESAFNPRAISNKGARGLMQLMPATAGRFKVSFRELFLPERNLEAGTAYLSWLLEHFDEDLQRALAAYNAGEGAVKRYGGVPPYRETRSYIRRIYSFLGLSLSTEAL